MALFQKSVLKKHLNDLNKVIVATAYAKFRAHFADAAKQANIKNSKEEQYQSGFLTDLFVDVLGYTLNPNTGYNLTTEHKNEKDSKKADGAILNSGGVVAVIELKGTNTVDLGQVETQAFGYKNNQKGCRYVVTSNFEKLRFYIEDSVEHIEFNLFKLDEEDFKVLYLCLQKDNLLADLPFKIKEASITEEQSVTKKLYKDYSTFKRLLYQNIVALNPQFDKVLVYKKTQKLLDRFLFILFAEDKQLLPPNSIRQILQQWNQLKELDEHVPLYDRYKKYFGYMNTGYKGKQHDIFAYNGGLFAPDEVLDNIQVNDTLLYDSTHALSQYDFETEVDVNILGHIFEHSLNDVDAVTAEAEGRELEKDKTRRKKDGVFYTPKYITKYIVENTVGKLCEEKKAELLILDEDYSGGKKKKDKKELNQRLEDYRNWLLQLTILDPACGSGAFLNQALEFLIAEHRKVDELRAKLFEDAMVMTDVENHILENNLYGVDLNEESIEIAKLSLWLRTARKGRKLSSLNKNIRNGNSLIDDPAVAGDKAFNWPEQFPNVFAKGGFDVVIGNPPYVPGKEIDSALKYYFKGHYDLTVGKYDLYLLFTEKVIKIVKPRYAWGLIIPNTFLANENATLIRKKILSNRSLELIRVFSDDVFADASVESVIPICNSNQHEKFKVYDKDDELITTFSTEEIANEQSSRIQVTINIQDNAVLNKIDNISIKLQSISDICIGIQIGGAEGSGSNKAQYIALENLNDTFKKYLDGKDFEPYRIRWSGQYLAYGDWLHRKRDEKYFLSPKILIRQIGNTPVCALDKEHYYTLNTIYNLISTSDKYLLETLFLLINSKVVKYYWSKKFSDAKTLFPKIKKSQINEIPLPNVIAQEKENYLLKCYERMETFNTSLQALQSQFLSLLQSNFEIAKPSTKLQNWYELDFKEFLAELKKAKVTLTLPQQAEWMTHFNNEKQKALTLKNDIDKTDKEIDQLVYQLYGLTPDEIKIVEGN